MVIHGTPAMHQAATLLGTNATIAWLYRDMRTSKLDVATTIAEELGTFPEDVSVIKHYPEAFLVQFFHRHHYADAVGRHELPFGSTKLQLCPWRLEAHAKNVDLIQHVHLCLEGLPLQAWDEHAVASIIRTRSSIDYIEPASKLKTEMEVLGIWAWTTSPAKVPRMNWITLPAHRRSAGIRRAWAGAQGHRPPRHP